MRETDHTSIEPMSLFELPRLSIIQSEADSSSNCWAHKHTRKTAHSTPTDSALQSYVRIPTFCALKTLGRFEMHQCHDPRGFSSPPIFRAEGFNFRCLKKLVREGYSAPSLRKLALLTPLIEDTNPDCELMSKHVRLDVLHHL